MQLNAGVDAVGVRDREAAEEVVEEEEEGKEEVVEEERRERRVFRAVVRRVGAMGLNLVVCCGAGPGGRDRGEVARHTNVNECTNDERTMSRVVFTVCQPW